MGSFSVQIGTHIKFQASEVPAEFVRTVLAALTIENPQKERALRELVRGAHKLPDWIQLWTADGDTLVLPRGFVHDFEWMATQAGLSIEWDSSMVEVPGPALVHVPPVSLRDYQTKAVDELFDFANGIYQAPTASGKTRVMLELIRFCQQRTIVFVEKTDLADQWVGAATDLDFHDVGLIGAGSWEERDLTIALRQSIWSRHEELQQQGWFNNWGMVVTDEAHHAISDTYWTLIQQFPAYYRLGCSATPVRDEETFPIARAVLGPVVHETPPEEAGEALVDPTIKVIKTNFSFDYQPTHRVLNEATGRWHRVQNNYGEMMTALQSDVERNSLVVRTALREALEGHACLVLSRRKEHLREMCSLLQAITEETGEHIDYFMVTGDNSSGAQAIYGAVDQLPRSIVFSTLADEGTDVPRWDRLFLAYPARKKLLFEQAIGRILRRHPKKTDAVAYDFMDERVDLLKGQFRSRRQELYNPKGWAVEFVN